MIKTLIVEDEFLVRMGLKTAIDWQSHGFEIVGEATNGLDGFTMFLNSQPKLILTDIKMPKMDGISLIKKVRAIDENVKFIVLTAYTDFPYTKAAIELGVVSYLLKGSLLNNELEDTLDHLFPKLCGHMYTQPSQGSKESEIKLEEAIKQKMTLSDLLTVSGTPEEYVYAACLRMTGEKSIDSFPTFCSLCLNILTERQTVFRHIADGKYLYLFAKSDKPPLFEMKYLCDSVARYLGREIFCGISLIQESSDLISLHADFAKTACENNMMKPCENIQEYTLPLSNVSEKIDGAFHLLNEAIIKQDRSLCVKTLHEIMDELQRLSSLKLFNRTLYRLILLFIQYDETLNETDILKNLYELDRIDQFSELLEAMLLALCAYTSPALSRKEIYVEQAKRFVQTNLDKNIKLYNVSEHVHVSSNYLGKLFFNETGVYLNNYIASEKVTASCKLLRETNLSISDIARKVGMNDQQYFSKLFKKEMGCTPKEYIQKCKH